MVPLVYRQLIHPDDWKIPRWHDVVGLPSLYDEIGLADEEDRMRFAEISLAGAFLIFASLTVSGFEALPAERETGEDSSKGRDPARQALSLSKAGVTDRQPALEADTFDEAAAKPSTQNPEIRELPEKFLIRLPMDDQYYSQLTDTDRPNTCGPTSLLMILDYFNLEESLDTVIRKHEFPAAEGGYDPNCSANPVCTSPGALVRVAKEEYGLAVEAHEGWTFEEIRQSLAAGSPIIADIVWRLADDGPGHFVVIFGIDTSLQTLTYHDPYDGADMTVSWEEFKAAWDGPVDRGDPLKPEGHKFWGMEVRID
jgi:uncharacterized protein YvpB